MRRNLAKVIFIIIGFFLILNLARGVWGAYKDRSKLTEAQNKLNTLRVQNEQLKNQLQYEKSDFFVEKEARDKLDLIKRNEVAVVLPQIKSAEGDPKQLEANLPNWQRWWRVFF